MSQEQQSKHSPSHLLQYWWGNPVVELEEGFLKLSEQTHSCLCIKEVPNDIAIRQLGGYLLKFAKYIRELRVMKGTRHDAYIVLIQSKSEKLATYIRTTLDGERFNKFEEHTYSLAYLSQTLVEGELPRLRAEKSVKTKDVKSSEEESTEQVHEMMKSGTYSLLPAAKLFNKPTTKKTCTICLERLSEQNEGGFIITILCGHSFHGECLLRWKDNTCPLCRFQQSPVTLQHCEKCVITQNLWKCLICGHIGCFQIVADDDVRINEMLDRNEELPPSSLSPQQSFYLEVTTNHAQEHFEKEGHLYAIHLENKNVWNFSKGGYVYRLIQAEVDKLIEIEEPHQEIGANPLTQEEQLDGKFALLSAPQQLSKKVRALESEYNGVLASQLDEQRSYFEEQLKRLKKEVAERKKELKREAQEKKEEAKAREERVEPMEKELKEAQEDLIKQNEKERILQDKHQSLMKEKQRLFKILEERKASQQRELTSLNQEIQSAEEVLKDLRTHISAQQSLKGKQVEEGQVFVLGKASLGKMKKKSSKK